MTELSIFCTRALVLFLLATSIFACNPSTDSNNLFTRMDGAESGFVFNNQLTESDSINAFRFLYMYNGAGVGLGDLNNDGLLDVVMAGNMVTSQIFINQGGFSFNALTESSGFVTTSWVHGVSIVDINNDDFDDIYLSVGGIEPSKASENLLFINNGDLTFSKVDDALGLASQSLTTHTAFFDADNDGDLDAFLLNYENNPNKDPNIIRPKRYSGNSISQDQFFLNENGQFIEATEGSGINQEGYGLGVHIADFNEDGLLDIYVSNDFAFDDNLYINQGNGKFNESLQDYFRHTANFGMGVDYADVDNDGLNDLLQVDMLPEDNRRQKKLLSGMNYDRHQLSINRGYSAQYMRNMLQLGNENSRYDEVGNLVGVSNTDWSWSPLIADFDNDGNKDIFITNGYVKDVTDVDFRDYIIEESRNRNASFNDEVVIQALQELKGEPTSNYLYKNSSGLTFNNVAQEWGLATPSYSTGAAYGDLDNDGDLDLIVNNLNSASFLYQNRSNENAYVQFDLNTDQNALLSVGTKVKAYTNTGVYAIEMNPFRGFQSSVSQKLHLGLGQSTSIDSVHVIWNDQTSSTLYGVDINAIHTLNKSGLSYETQPKVNVITDKSFEDVSTSANLDYKHKESGFVDFKREPLIPHKLSTEGPVSEVADVTGNGLSDMFIGGPAGQPSYIYIQTSPEVFERVNLDGSEGSEATDAVFFDADADGDLDLYVVNGSNEFDLGSELYQDLLYINNGKGGFNLSTGLLPEAFVSGSVVLPIDIDTDGDLDLYVGGSFNPGQYPYAGSGQFLINVNGVFKDEIDQLAPLLKEIGMVKDAILADLDSDGVDEIVVTGEFMGIEVFEIQEGKIQPSNSFEELRSQTGWWNVIKALDIDNDGDLDLVGGNLGLNSRYKATLDEPLRIYARDFDSNGSVDAITTFQQDGNEYPYPDRALIAQQLTALKKKFNQNIMYAEATIEDVFPRALLNLSYQKEAVNMSNSIFINNGDGKFDVSPMPHQAQYSQINDMLILDYNNDGREDILIGGNTNALEVFTGNLDAQASLLLINRGDGGFESQSLNGTGFFNEGVITDLNMLDIGDEIAVLALRNNETLGLFRLVLTPNLSQD